MVALAAASMSQHGRAQSAPAPPDNKDDSGQRRSDDKGSATNRLETTTITATRRSEPARDVPMQVNTMSAQSLEQSGARSLTDYLSVQPGIDFKSSGAGRGAISIRGVSTGNQPIPTVGVYIDDVAFGSSSAYAAASSLALDMGLLDLNHIEILRGPQGTLYGAGAIGGVLKYVTNEPDTTRFSGKAAIGANFTHDGRAGYTVNTVVNVPVKEDVAALRVSAFRDKEGGYIDAVGLAGGSDVNRGDTTGARLSFLVEASPRLKLRLTATGQETKRSGNDLVDYDFVTGQPIKGALTRSLALTEPSTVKVGLTSADVSYDAGWALLSSISSAQSMTFVQQLDYTNVYGPLLGNPAFIGIPGNYAVHTSKQTQEFRITSLGKQTVEWLGGLYYTHESGSNQQVVNTVLDGGVSGPNLATASLPSGYIETAAYGDVTWNVNERLALTGGARVARNRQEFQQISNGLLVGGATALDGGSSETAKTYLLAARYLLDPTSSVYLRAASGYRPGGPNAVVKDPTTGLPLAPTTFQHDTLWSYEAGYKADLLDKTVSVEAAVYDIRWKQIQSFSAVNGVSVITNNGRAHIKGAELTTTVRPSTQLELTGSLSYIDGKALDTIPRQVVAGSRLPNSARLAANLGANYLFPMLGYPSYVGVTERLTGDRNAGFDASTSLPNYRLPGYALTDLQAGTNLGRFEVALYVRNALDRRAQVSASTSAVPLGGPVQVTPARPRTFGTTLTAQF